MRTKLGHCQARTRPAKGVSWQLMELHRPELERRPLGVLRPVYVHPDRSFDVRQPWRR